MIKKYNNRKLYLLSSEKEKEKKQKYKEAGRYISLGELLQLRKEDGIQVADNKTKKDITQEIVLSAICVLAKKNLLVRDRLISKFDELDGVIDQSELEAKTNKVILPLDVNGRMIKNSSDPRPFETTNKEDSTDGGEFIGF